jgi:pimeloyl-ACP methyl ester carboxylesterase
MHKKNHSGNYFFNRMLCLVSSLLLLCCSYSAHAEEVKIKHMGLTLNANLEMAEGSDFKDGIVLIVHGLWAHNKMEIVETSQNTLLDINRSSLAINLSLGIDDRHGFLDCNVVHRHTQEDTIDEIQAWIDWLKSQNVTDIVLMGHSRGGNYVLVYAAERMDPVVSHLLFLAPGTISTNAIFFTRQYGYNFDEIMQRTQKLIAAGKGDNVMPKTDFNYCPQAAVTANSFASYYSSASDKRFQNFVEYIPQLIVPTLIITGTADERQPDIEKNVRPYVDGKLIYLSVIEGAGHFFLDFNIEEAMEVAVEFLEETQI